MATMTAQWGKATESFVMVLALCLLLFSAGASAQGRTLLVMGDSLSAAYGLPAEAGWVALLGERLKGEGWTVVNASISGETTAGGASRISHALRQHRPDLVLIELGANDALRGLPLDLSKANLRSMIEASRKSGAAVMLIGMQIPPNYGPDYAGQFQQLFRELADEFGIPLLPFLLAPIATDREAFLPDQLHPDAEAQPRLLEHVMSVLRPALDAAATTAP
jgi:acyl-CoA thioesterase I